MDLSWLRCTTGCGGGQHGNEQRTGNAVSPEYVGQEGAGWNPRGANTLCGARSASCAMCAAAAGEPLDAKSLQAAVVTLRRRLTAHQAASRSLAEVNDILVTDVAGMRQEDLNSASQVFKSRRNTERKYMDKINPKERTSFSSRQDPVGKAAERLDRAPYIGTHLRNI